MSKHPWKSLFRILRLKKSRPRRLNRPEIPTSLRHNALTAGAGCRAVRGSIRRGFFHTPTPETDRHDSVSPHPKCGITPSRPLPHRLFRARRPPKSARGHASPHMPNISNDRARNALYGAETEKYPRPQTLLRSLRRARDIFTGTFSRGHFHRVMPAMERP